ncbi:hypothetical protein C8Q75DRAFT_737351 [Abortiporus biennis]|nr:hypothetical protein C8Q75DRAFT_737351 [Abortiporus biennis]
MNCLLGQEIVDKIEQKHIPSPITFRRIKLEWDTQQYFESSKGLGAGFNREAEKDIEEMFIPYGQGKFDDDYLVKIESPHIVVDIAGHILAWILPDIISKYLTDHLVVAALSIADILQINIKDMSNLKPGVLWRYSKSFFKAEDQCECLP